MTICILNLKNGTFWKGVRAMKRILITGANSYIGMSFARYLEQWPDSYCVDTVDMIGGSWREYDFSGYDAVYHVAGIAHSDGG